ncbi:MAG TPA: hypothetical protein VFN13_10935 [Rudaea sp.]|nr:hypothetical protein [Rudaea sp.]
MRSNRTRQATVLGHGIERIDEYDEVGLLSNVRYEVMCPYTGAVLTSRATLRAAKRYVILHELRLIRLGKRRQRSEPRKLDVA